MSYLLVENNSSVYRLFYPWQQPEQRTEGWEPYFKLVRNGDKDTWIPLDDAGGRDDISGYKLPRSDWSKSTQTATSAAKSRPLDFQATDDNSDPPLNL